MKVNLLWRENEELINYSDILNLKLEDIVPSVAGPKRPQDKISLDKVKDKFIDILRTGYERRYVSIGEREEGRWLYEGGQLRESALTHDFALLKSADVEIETAHKSKDNLKSVEIKFSDNEFQISDGSVVIAAITSCTNTSNPAVMLGSGLIARNAIEKGLKTKPWVKTSLAPGSRVVTEYFKKANLIPFLEGLGFHIVGYGCTTCIGNSGQLPAHIRKAIIDNNLITASVLSGNRNFEARIHSLVKMNFLMSPILVVAYALAGRIDINFYEEPLGYDPNFQPVFLKDIWPAPDDIQKVMSEVLDSKDYKHNYKTIFKGNDEWNRLKASKSEIYNWNSDSSYIKEAPFFKNISASPENVTDIISANVLLKLGDSITTDHISPAGAIAEDSPAGQYLSSLGIEKNDFNSYGSRRGNHEVMVRGTFANVRLKNHLTDKEGGWTVYSPDGKVMTVFDAAMKYKENKIPLIILAGKEYGSGSSRDWAAKGVSLLGVKAVIAESFERIHRSNLVGMGVLPLQFEPGENCDALSLKGDETYNITYLNELYPNKRLKVIVKRNEDTIKEFNVIARLDSQIETDYYQNGGILQYVLRKFLNKES